LLKEPKIYFFDQGLVKGDKGAKFENFVGTCLMKHVLAKIDYQAENYTLQYLHTKEGHEVDFVLAKEKHIEKMIEVKYAESSIDPNLRYFQEKYNLPGIQVVKELKQQRVDKGIEVIQGLNFLKDLYL
jgi:predicted AAA+ superfamily ATPase